MISLQGGPVQPRRLFENHSLAEIKHGISVAGLVPPHAFIRKLNAAYDLEVHHRHLLRELPSDADFRLCFGRGADERWVLMEKLPWDSAFFSRGVARLHAVLSPFGRTGLRCNVEHEIAATKAACERAGACGVEYIFCSAEARDLPLIRTLGASGFELIETRSYYHSPLTPLKGERYPTRLATPADIPSLARTARESVNDFDRFHADPAIPPADADRLMERWVLASIQEGFADATLVPDVEEPEAFITAKHHREHWDGWNLRLAQPVFGAVSPAFRGWYLRILSELNEHLRTGGAEHIFLITQITNNAVIRTWEKLGFSFGKCEHVYRRLL